MSIELNILTSPMSADFGTSTCDTSGLQEGQLSARQRGRCSCRFLRGRQCYWQVGKDGSSPPWGGTHLD
eukprot:6930020-Prymnesium_polylepis.1